MPIRIVSVKMTPAYSWDNISDLKDWKAVKNTNTSWETLTQTSIIGQSVKIEVEVTEGTWTSIKDLFASWDVIRSKFINWLGIKNW